MGHAYAPYSQFPVGAAGLVDDGRVRDRLQRRERRVRRRACARSAAWSRTLHITGGGRLTHVVCVNGEGEVIMPCGRCRQLLCENGGPDLLLWTVSGVKRMDEVLPDAFGPDDLD